MSEEQQSDVKIKYGYIIAVIDDEKSTLKFEVLGDTGLVELLGLHECAKFEIEKIRDIRREYGFPMIIQALTGLGQHINIHNQALKQNLGDLTVPLKELSNSINSLLNSSGANDSETK